MNEDEDIIWGLFTEATQPNVDSMIGDEESEEAQYQAKQFDRDFYVVVIVPGAHGINTFLKKEYIGEFGDIDEAIIGAKYSSDEVFQDMNFTKFPDGRTQAAATIAAEVSEEFGDYIVLIGAPNASEAMLYAIERGKPHQALPREFDNWLSQFELL